MLGGSLDHLHSISWRPLRRSGLGYQLEGAFSDLLHGVVPSQRKLSAARRIFGDIWDHRLARSKKQAALYGTRIAELDRQIGQLLDRLIDADGKSVIAAYEKRIGTLEEEKLVLSERPALRAPRKPLSRKCSNSRAASSQTLVKYGIAGASTCRDWC